MIKINKYVEMVMVFLIFFVLRLEIVLDCSLRTDRRKIIDKIVEVNKSLKRAEFKFYSESAT